MGAHAKIIKWPLCIKRKGKEKEKKIMHAIIIEKIDCVPLTIK